MIKLKKLIFTFLIILIPSKAFALTGTANISCTPTTPKPGTTISCSVSGTSDADITLFAALIKLGDGLTVDGKLSLEDDFEMDDLFENKIGVIRTDPINGKFNVGKFNVKVDATATGELEIGLSNVKIGDDNGTVDLADAKTTITIDTSGGGSTSTDDTSLSNIEIINGKIKSVSIEDRQDILAEISSGTFGFRFTTSNPDYADKIVVTDVSGNQINDIENITYNTTQLTMAFFVIINGDEAGKYIIGVARKASGDNTLKSLTVAGKSIDLSNPINKDGSNTYEVTIDISNLLSIRIEAELNDPDNFKFGEVEKPDDWPINSNSIAINVEPKDTSSGDVSRSYIINIKTIGGSSSSTSSENPNSEEPIDNPQTGSISAFIMAMILIASFVASLSIYKKNIEGYK